MDPMGDVTGVFDVLKPMVIAAAQSRKLLTAASVQQRLHG